MLNKQGKSDTKKIFFRYVSIAILALGYFFLNHPGQSLHVNGVC